MRKISNQRVSPLLGTLTSLVLLLALAGPAWGITNKISFAFQGRAFDGDPVGYALQPTDVAGVVPLANWNGQGGAGTVTTGQLKDNLGNLVYSEDTVTAVTLSWNANDNWYSDGCTGNPNCTMMKGIIKAGGTPSTDTFSFNHIANGYYNLILYAEENGAGSLTDFGTLASIGGVTTGVTNYIVEDNNFQGTFIRADNTNAAATRPTGNYVLFQNVVPSGSQIAWTMSHVSGTDGSGLAGVQLLPKLAISSASVTPASQTRVAGMPFTVFVVAVGDDYPTVQWYTNGTAVAGATLATYTGTTPPLGYSLSVYAIVSNLSTPGGVTSSTATVTPQAGQTLVLTDADIGGPAQTGSLVENTDGSYTIKGGGADIWNGNDQFNYAYVAVGGDFDAQVRLDSLTGTQDEWARYGLMVRPSLNNNSREFFAFKKTGAATVQTLEKMQAGWAVQNQDYGFMAYPVWLRITRQGSILTAYTSSDGSAWTLQRTEDTSTWSDNGGVGSMHNAVFVGVALSGHNILATGTFSQFNITGTGAFAIGSPSTPIDTLQGSTADGNRGGVAGIYLDPNGATLAGGGAGVGGVSDACTFEKTIVTGDFDLAVRLDSLGGRQDGAQAGLMARESLAANSRYIFNFMTLTNGSRNSSRRVDGAAAVENNPTTMTVPMWQRLKRVGNVFYSYRSQDGVNWTQSNTYDTDDNGVWMHGPTGAPLAGTLYVGRALSSRTAGSAAFARFSPVVSLLGTTVVTLNPSNTVIQAPPQETTSWTYGFSGLVGGPPPITIQWQKKKITEAAFVSIPGATNLSYSYTGAQDASDLGAQFQFIATGPGGTVTSATATLTNLGLGFRSVENINMGVASRSTWQYGLTSSGANGSFDLIGGGTDIWGADDSFTYASDNITGDFDIKTRVDAFIQANDGCCGRAGLMVRETSDQSSRYVALLSYDPRKSEGDWRNQQRTAFDGGEGGSYGSFTSSGWSSYPDNWMRITREGNVFTTYRSRNGTNWNITGRFDTSVVSNWPAGPLAATVKVGLASQAHNGGGWAALARFRNTTLTAAGAGGPSWSLAAIHYRKWMDVGAGLFVSDLTNNWKFNGGVALSRGNNVADCWPSLPSFADPVPSLTGTDQAGGRWTVDQFGSVIGGVFVVPVDGAYTFRLGTGAGTDDRSELYLSSDAQRTNLSLVPIAQDNVNAGASAALNLVAGRYWLEAILKEATGGNACAVQVQGPGGTMTNLMADSFVPSYIVRNTVYTNAGLQITQQPVSVTTNELKPASFTVAATVTPLQPITYQWYSNDVAIAYAVGPTYTIASVAPGAPINFKCVVSATGTNLTSDTAVLTVLTDNTAPTVLSVRQVIADLPLGTPPSLVDVTFSEGMKDSTASVPGNYLLNNGASVVSATRWSLDGTLYRLVLSGVNAELDNYALTLTANLTDPATTPNPLVATNFPILFFKAIKAGVVRREEFQNIGGTTWINDLLNEAIYKGNLPSTVDYLTTLNSPQSSPDIGNYGIRVSGWIIAPLNGNYVFHVYGDDECRFYIGTNENPASLPLAANATVRYPDGVCCGGGYDSGNVPLVAGNRYYFEGFMKEGGGGDSWNVTWKTPVDSGFNQLPTSAIFFGIQPYYIGHFTSTIPALSIPDGAVRTFSISATSSEPAYAPANILYQWYTNGVAYAYATNATVALQAPVGYVGPWTVACVGTGRLESGSAPGWGQYLRLFTNSTVQTVFADATGPSMIAAISDYTTTNLTVTFSEAVDSVTAGTAANYAVDGGVSVLTAVRKADGSNVLLTTTFMLPDQTYNVTNLGGVKDLSAAQNQSALHSVPVTKWLLQKGFARLDFFTSVTDGIDAFLTGARFAANVPDVSFYTNVFGLNVADTALNSGYDNYAGRVLGYFVPPSNGLYRFYIRQDDDGRLFLNTNANPALSTAPNGLTLIVSQNGANANFTAYNTTLIPLNAGQKYLMMGVWKEGGGGDGMTVAFRYGVGVNNPPTNPDWATAPTQPDWTLGSYFYTLVDPAMVANTISVSVSPLPATTNVQESLYSTVTYTATAAATPRPPVFYQWQRSDSPTGTFTDMQTPNLPAIPFNSYRTPVLHPPNQYYRVVAYALGGANATSAVAEVTFTADTTVPTLLTTTGDPDLGHVTLAFNELLDPVSAQTAANYTLSDGVTVVAATLQPNGSNVVLTTSMQLTNQFYYVTNNGVKDISTAGNPTVEVVSSFTTWPLMQGYVREEIFYGLPTGNDIVYLTNSTVYRNGAFSFRTYTNFFGWMVDPANGAMGNLAEQYGARASAWFQAPSNGVYRFFVRSDDASELWMNTNSVDSMNPSGQVLIASELISGHAYTDYSVPITLTGGQLYSMMGLLKEGGSTEGLAVTFRAAPVGGTPTTTAPPIAEMAPGWLFYSTIDPAVSALSGVNITLQPVPATTNVNEWEYPVITYPSAAVGTPLPADVLYTWQQTNNVDGFTNIPFAHAASYTTPILHASTSYRLIASSFTAYATSEVVSVTVAADLVPPVLTNFWYNPAGTLTTLYLTFSERMSLASVQNLANYTFSPGVTAVSATLAAPNVVALTVTQTVVGAHTLLTLDLIDTALAANHVITNNLPFTTVHGLAGAVRRDAFLGLVGLGNSPDDLFNHAKWPNQPDLVDWITDPVGNLDAAYGGVNQETYGMRYAGHIIAPVNGTFYFHQWSDDGARFALSTNDSYQNIVTYTPDSYCCGVDKTYGPVTLVAGQAYYFQGVVKEGDGGDNLDIRWQLPGAAGFTDIPSANLAFIYDVAPLTQPASVNVYGGSVVNFNGTFTITGAAQAPGVLRHQWQILTNGGATWDPIPGAVSNSYTRQITCVDGGAAVRLVSFVLSNFTSTVSNNLVAFTSTPATISILPNGPVPTLLRVWTGTSFTNVYLAFDKLMEPASANTVAGHYALTDGVMNPVTIYSATLQADGSNVVLTTDPISPGGTYQLTSSGVNDLSCPTPQTTALSTTTFSGSALRMGVLAADVWTSPYGGAPASALDTVINASAAGVQPNYRTTLRSFDWHTQPMHALNAGITYSAGWDNYAIRISGWFLPPLSGVHTYKFYGRGDDATRFFMNTNGADRAGKVEIARNDGCCTGYANGDVSMAIALTNGTPYYFEGWMTEGGGADLLQMTYVVDGAPAPFSAPDGFTWFMYPGEYVATAANFGLYMNPDGTGAPVSFTVDLPGTPIDLLNNGDSVTLNVLAVSAPDGTVNAIRYQWQTSTNGGVTWDNQLPPATNFLCDYDMLGAGTNYTAQYYMDTLVRVLAIGVPSGVTNISAVASINVPDSLTPLSIGSLDGIHFTLVYDQMVDPDTATRGSWYIFRDSAGSPVDLADFTAPVLQSDGRTVTFILQKRIQGPFSVDIGDVNDYTYAILPLGRSDYGVIGNLPSHVAPADYANDIGSNPGVTDPILRGSVLPVTPTKDGYTVTAGGTGITNTADGMYFVGWQMWGDFDILVHVPVLTNRYQNMPDAWSRAGLVARVGTSANALNLAVVVTPPTGFGWDRNGANRAEMTARPTAGGATLAVADGAANLWDGGNTPWVRLQRTGNLFTGSYSTNGTDWITLSAVDTTPFGGAPPSLYVGLGTASGNNTANPSAGLVTAEYTDLYKPMPPMVSVTPVNPVIGVSNIPPVFTASVTNDPDTLIGGAQWIKWLKDGVEIPGETGYTLTLTSAQPAGVHTITALIGNNGGATPVSATLTVSNSLPALVDDTFTATQNVARTFTTAELLNGSDPEGAMLSFAGLTSSNAIRFATDFNDSSSTNGMTITGSAYLAGGALHLTDSAGSLAGMCILPDFVGRPVHGFKATLKVRIADLNGGADGMSFFFGNTGTLNFPNGNEEGPDPFNGLTIVLDNYDNNKGVPVAEAPAIDIKWQNTNLLAHALLGAKIDTGAGYADVTVTLHADGKVDVVAAGVPVHTGVQIPGFVPMTGRFGLAARTGGAWEAHWLDSLSIAAIIEPAGVGFVEAAPAGTFTDYASQAGGAVALSGGMVTYTPPTGFSGPDRFYYIASDGQPGGNSIGTVLVNVQALTVSGTVRLEEYTGLLRNGNGTRDVTFSFTSAGVTNHVPVALTFAGGEASYNLNVPGATPVRVSAKTAWNLRKTESVSFTGTSATASFVLLAGDLNGSNAVGLDDYFELASFWYSTNPAADIDGSGTVDLDDYFLLINRWGQTGDLE